MNGRVYVSSFENVTIAAVQDLFNLLMPTDVHAEIISVYLGQTSLTAQENLEIKATRATTSGSVGSTPARNPLDPSMPPSDGIIRANDTTQGTPGVVLLERVWNILVPFEYLPVPDARIQVPGLGRLIFELETTPTSMTAYGEIKWKEFG